MMYHYHVFGFSLVSEIECAPLMASAPNLVTDDSTITIKKGKISTDGLADPTTKALYYQVTDNEYWLHVPPVGYFLVSNGESITVAPKKNIDNDSLCEYILTVCLGVICLQRHLFVMSGSTIKIGRHAFAIAGSSGVGKSTLTCAFMKRGYSILSDELSLIAPGGDAQPGMPFLKLWFDAIKQLEIDPKPLKKIRPALHKFFVPMDKHYHASPLPLKMLYLLNDRNQKDYDYEPVLGVKKIPCLINCLYKNTLLTMSENQKHLSLQAVKLANQIGITRVVRPDDDFKLNECVDYLENDLKARGLLDG